MMMTTTQGSGDARTEKKVAYKTISTASMSVTTQHVFPEIWYSILITEKIYS